MGILSFVTAPFETLFATSPIENPAWFALIPFAFILLLIIMRMNFVQLSLGPEQRRRRQHMQIYVFCSRILIITLLAIALATPYIETQTTSQGNPEITLLIDESTSMEVFDTTFTQTFQEQLEQRIPTTTRIISTGESSPLGDALLDALEPGSNVLLISDGNVESGTALEDVAFFAANELSASISAITLEAKEKDASVFISGPETVVAGTSNAFVVHVTKNHESPVTLQVSIDGVNVFSQITSEKAITFEKELSIGDHRITARIDGTDYFPQNNAFYKTVTVLEKPAILLLSQKNSPVESVLNELYSVTKVSSIPSDLSKYYAIVANDVEASRFTNFNALQEFLLDEEAGFFGGGLVVLGGFNSYDRGGYQNSPIETLLPVSVGKGESKKGDDNIIIILDISGGSTGVRNVRECDNAGNCEWVEVRDEVSALDIIKAQTVHLVSSEKNILATNKVGVIAFGAQGTLDEASGGDYQASDTVKLVEPLDYLYNNQGRITQKVPRLVGGGPSEIGLALQSAYDILKTKQGGSNYVLLLSDGNVGPSVQKQASLAVENLQRRGIKVFTYGVGRNAQNVMGDFLTTIAQKGDGLYEGPVFTTNDVSPARISIQWGNPEQKGFGDSFSLIPFSLTHFITQGLEPTAVLNGFNQVFPKDNAKILLTTDFGQPALTVNNYGNGRVAALTVFTGGGLGELLNAQNSVIITRTVNWAIGDPQRKQDFFVEITDARINIPATAVVHSQETLSAENVEFIKDGDTYTARFTPTSLGFNQFFGATYATNYIREYQRVGMHPGLNSTVDVTGGKIFNPQDVDAIVEHIEILSKRTTLQKKDLRWPFVSLALILFLAEIFVRRVKKSN